MRNRRLLDRQISLLAHLTDPRAFTGVADPDLAGIDPAQLRLMGEMSLGKRMEKVAAILPKTVELLGAAMDELTAVFARTFPPQSARAIDNARQFAAFAPGRVAPAFVADIAAVELAIAEVGEAMRRARQPARRTKMGRFRRSPTIRQLRCAHDVRGVLEREAAEPQARETFLVVAPPARVFEVAAPVHSILARMDGGVTPSQIARWLGGDAQALLATLTAAGIVEAAP
jgi:hypothetical protein